MLKPATLLLISFVILCWSCNDEHGYSYTIKDFRKSLQPHLIKIVSKGIVMGYDSSLRHMATDNELRQLSQSEHPVLRASAFREMLVRKSFNHFDILMSHLDDTAIVATNDGEFGLIYPTVSDDILRVAKWKNIEDKNKTINEVITKHNYLKSAYIILRTIEPREKLYPFIKEMATRARNYSEEYGEQSFEEIEYALYGLAKFKKKEDINIIRSCLLYNLSGLGLYSFRLMEEFPDTSYLSVYESYYPRAFYRSIFLERNIEKAEQFIYSVSTYKNERSAKILDSMLNNTSFKKNQVDNSLFIQSLVHAIWNNKCTAYSKLRKQIEKRMAAYEQHTITPFPVNPSDTIADSSEEKIRWLN